MHQPGACKNLLVEVKQMNQNYWIKSELLDKKATCFINSLTAMLLRVAWSVKCDPEELTRPGRLRVFMVDQPCLFTFSSCYEKS